MHARAYTYIHVYTRIYTYTHEYTRTNVAGVGGRRGTEMTHFRNHDPTPVVLEMCHICVISVALGVQK